MLPGSLGDVAVSFTPPTSDGGNPITSYTVTVNSYQRGIFSVTGTSSPIIVSGLDSDAYLFGVQANNSKGASIATFHSTYLALLPANDRFTTPLTITGASGTVSATSAISTKDSGEPTHAGVGLGHSVWFRWVAPQSGTVVFDTCPPSFTELNQFFTVLAAYTGSAVNALTEVGYGLGTYRNGYGGCTYNSGFHADSLIRFTATAGQTYYVALDNSNNNGILTGEYTFHWYMP